MDKIKTLVLSGGIGGSRFLKGLQLLPELEITAVINNGDDITMHGLRICPDIDSVIYNLANISNTVNGWGRSEETWAVQKELEFYSGRPTWFNLGDKDFATHIYRTQNLAAGEKLHKIISNIVELRKIKIKILPSTDDIVETQVLLRDNHEGRNSMHFQEWWVKFRGNLQVAGFFLEGRDFASPSPGVLESIKNADLIILPPSNPVVSVGMILQIPGILETLKTAKAPIIGVSPIVGEKPVLGMADKCLQAIGFDSTPVGVANFYGSRSHNGLLDGWLVADSDKKLVNEVLNLDIKCKAVPLMMKDETLTKDLAIEVLELYKSTL
jgi:LPPG:FO 2-phospho-L-lactate transferase